jgi:hypothetical protein
MDQPLGSRHPRGRPVQGQRCLRRRLLAGALGLTGAWASQAAPPAFGAPPGAWSVGVIGGQALDHNLPEVLPKGLSGELSFEPARVGGLVLRLSLEPPAEMADWAERQDVGLTSSLELGLLQASGLANNTELTLDWRPAFTPWQWGPVALEFAWGVGVSYSLGRPWSDYTDPDRPDGHRLLFHMAPELALQHSALPDWSLSLRLHHRSGLYGLFGPRRVGSNHLVLVLMHRL